MSFGFRNPFDISFNADGELFTYDADAEGSLGNPWYRPTRINHVISGADFGWRPLVNKWPAYYFDSFGEVMNIGSGSPTGSIFGTGARFPEKYQRALFVSDWSFGKLYAIHLTPDGASYRGTAEEFITGQPFPISDVVISPYDGAMYLTVGGRSTQSALYRVSYVGTESTNPASIDLRGRTERTVRRHLESYHGIQHESAVGGAWSHLADQDRSIRYAARIALEWQDLSTWREQALAEKDPRTAIAAIAALARASTTGTSYKPQAVQLPNRELQSRMLETLGRIDWNQLSDPDQIDLVRTYTLVFTRTGAPDEATRKSLAGKFEQAFPAQTKEANGLLARLLVYLQAEGAPAKLVAAIRTAPSQQEQIDYALQLRLQRTGWTVPLREEYFRWFIDAYANYRGGIFFLSGIVNIRAAALETLTDQERADLKEILAVTPSQVSPLQRVVDRPFVKEWTVDELTPIIETKLKSGDRNFDAGRRLFGEVACAVCHGFGYEGGSVGPELTGSGGRYSVHDLLESIIEPSKVISDQFAAMTFHLADGSVVTGRVANALADTISVSVNMFDYTQLVQIPRSDIAAMEESSTSMMPPGMINNLNEDQIANLVAYILSLNNRLGPMFEKP
jgi:putative heme-binding domain-containing protein